MKRISSTLLAAALVGGGILAAPATYADTTIYGSVRSGIIHYGSDGDTKAAWDLGSSDTGDVVDADTNIGAGGDKLWSRIGVKASHDLGNGLTSGLHIEKRLDRWRTRYQNVWLSGTFGRVTLGQQGRVYHPAVSWDGTNLWGNALELAGSRGQGIKYSSALDGPFSFNAMITDDNSQGSNTGRGDGLDIYEISASFTMTDVASVSLGYLGQDSGGTDLYGGSVGGSVAGLDWDVGYEKSNADDSETRFGAFLSYAGFYGFYEDKNTESNVGENDHILFGYSRSLGTNTKVIIEHSRPDSGRNRTALALRVDF